MKVLIQCGWIGVAGFFGAITRFLITRIFTHAFGPDFPVGTMVINLTGCLLLGWFTAFAAHKMAGSTLFLAIATGFIGAYTTFSTFAFDSNALFSHGATGKALFNLIVSIALGLLAVRAGLWLGAK